MLQDGDRGVIIQRDKATYAIAPHIPCGVVSPGTLRKLADVADKYGAAALKLTSAARIAIVGLKEEDIEPAWSDLDMSPGAAVGLCVRSVKACPGTTFCKRGQQDSLGVGLKLDAKYHGLQLAAKMKMGVSGCPNQCAETCIKDIGLVGTRKGWRILVGGNGGAKARLSEELAAGLTEEQALATVDKILDFYRANAKPRERIGKMIDRLGLDALRAAAVPGEGDEGGKLKLSADG